VGTSRPAVCYPESAAAGRAALTGLVRSAM